MIRTAYNILRLVRPRQWIKNLSIFAAITFGGELFNIEILNDVLLGFLVFCGLSSAAYIVNDYFDIEKDRMHPFKRFRPLASGDVGKNTALLIAGILTVGSLFVSVTINPAFFAITIIYLLLQLSYSTILKSITVIDILAIASGYILRVYAGEFASGLHISVWLLLTTISISLFLAIGKRRSELTLLSGSKVSNIAATRKTLSHYSERLLDVYTSVFATSTFISYSLFTFLENQGGSMFSFILMPDFAPEFFQRKWLMLTIIPVVYGLMRYMQDIYEKNEGESPEKVLLSDIPLLATITIWGLLVIFIVYFLGI